MRSRGDALEVMRSRWCFRGDASKEMHQRILAFPEILRFHNWVRHAKCTWSSCSFLSEMIENVPKFQLQMTSAIPSLYLTPLSRKCFPTSAFTWSYFRTTDGNTFFFKGKQVFWWKFFVIHKKSSCHSSTKKTWIVSLYSQIFVLSYPFMYIPQFWKVKKMGEKVQMAGGGRFVLELYFPWLRCYLENASLF